MGAGVGTGTGRQGRGQISFMNCRYGAVHGAELSNAAGVGERRTILVSACPRQEKLHWNRSPH